MKKKMSHRQKVHLARKLRTPDEIKNNIPIFDSVGWEKRKVARENKIKKIHEAKEKRKAEKERNLRQNKLQS